MVRAAVILETPSDTMLSLCLLFVCLPLASIASPLHRAFNFLSGNGDKGPTYPVSLELPYGTFKSEYDENSDMYLPLSQMPAA